MPEGIGYGNRKSFKYTPPKGVKKARSLFPEIGKKIKERFSSKYNYMNMGKLVKELKGPDFFPTAESPHLRKIKKRKK
tara:strand:- start:3365 stop:3598 length:234 start_codon:yes stop_codon:yes gene_type:complete